LDLDPGPPAGLVECARVALGLRELMLELELEPFVKTSGSLGLHVHAPLPAPLDTKSLARKVSERLAAKRPQEVVAVMRKSARPGRVYVDWLQNDPSRQTVAPYSLRGVPRPLAAVPVDWQEIEHAVDANRPGVLEFAPEAVLARIAEKGDVFAPLL
jgi:bifunctional non-homologous end joining protein LigD